MERVTIYDVAKLAKVSPTTVSRALHDHPAISKKTKQRVQATCPASIWGTTTPPTAAL